MTDSVSTPAPQNPPHTTGTLADDQSQKSLLEVALMGAIALAKKGKNYTAANEQIDALVTQIHQESPVASVLIKQLWAEYISVQRSAVFYESLSEAEAGLSEKMAQSNIQLKQNYMRLIQEQ